MTHQQPADADMANPPEHDVAAVFRHPAALFALAALLLTGCAVASATNPPRSATEQLLLSTAADRAIYSADLNIFADKKVFLDGTYFDSYDPKYVLGTIRDALSRAGAKLVAKDTDSDIIVEARSGGLSIDASQSFFGLPQTGVPIPLAGVLSIPELALYKSSRQYSYAKLALLAYDTHTRAHVYSSPGMLGKSHNTYYTFLGFIQWTGTDIPEKKRK
jgi:hypothetical protein